MDNKRKVSDGQMALTAKRPHLVQRSIDGCFPKSSEAKFDSMLPRMPVISMASSSMATVHQGKHHTSLSETDLVLQFLNGDDTAGIKVEYYEGYYMDTDAVQYSLNKYLKHYGMRLTCKCNDAISPKLLARTKNALRFRKKKQRHCVACGNRSAEVAEALRWMYCKCDVRGDISNRTVYENMKISEQNDLGQWIPVQYRMSKNSGIPIVNPSVANCCSATDVFASKTQTEQAILVCTNARIHNAVVLDSYPTIMVKRMIQHNAFYRYLVLVHSMEEHGSLDDALKPLARTFLNEVSKACRTSPIYNLRDLKNIITTHSLECDWEHKYDVIIVLKAHIIEEEILIFLKKLLGKNPQAALWLFGDPSPQQVPRYMLDAQKWFFSGKKWHHPSFYLSSSDSNNVALKTDICGRLDIVTMAKEWIHITPIVAAQKQPKRQDDHIYAHLLGIVIPLVYEARSRNKDLRRYLFYRHLKKSVWQAELKSESMEYDILRKLSTNLIDNDSLSEICGKKQTLSYEDLCFLLLCYRIEETNDTIEEQKLIALCKGSRTDWISHHLKDAFPRFNAIGLWDQERVLSIRNWRGKFDGRTKDGVVIELKFSHELLTAAHRFQVMLYYCIFRLTEPHEKHHDYCLLYNYRTGEQLELRLKDMDCATFLQKVYYALEK